MGSLAIFATEDDEVKEKGAKKHGAKCEGELFLHAGLEVTVLGHSVLLPASSSIGPAWSRIKPLMAF